MYVATEGPTDASIMLVGESPGEDEDKTGKPFVGYAGTTLNTLLSQAGIARYQCLVTNVARERPPANKISYFFEDKKCTIPKPKLQVWIDKLKEEIELYKPRVVVALGSTALWALTGEKKISEFRGYILPCTLVKGVKVLPTYHPQAVGYEWKLFTPTVIDLRKALRHSKFYEIPESKQTLIPNTDIRTFINYMEECIVHPEWEYLSVDVETVQPGSHIEELGLSHDPNIGMSIFLLKGRTSALPEKDELLLWQTFARLVKCKKVVMQNGAYDIGVIWYNQHILVDTLWMDTLIAAHIIWPELPRDLGFLGSVCLDIPPWKSKSCRTSEYNPSDAANALGIAMVLDKELDKKQMRHTFDFEMSLIPVALMMQLQGLKVDKEKQQELIKIWTEKRTEYKIQLDTILGKEINFNSSKQMQQLLYIELGLPVQYKRRKTVNEPRTMTTDANALRHLSRLVPDNPIFNLILEYKKADTLLRFLDVELSPEGRVHTSYNLTGASSDDEEATKKTKKSFGRWSSSGSIILPFGSGNLQNIPPEARKMYRAKPGWKIIEADYSQAEAVIVAYLTNNHKLIKMFKDSFGLSKTEKKPYDIHNLKASELYGIPMDLVTPEQRRVGKTVRHARNYCHDDKTEVLTEDGWKPIFLVNKEVDKVAQWSSDGVINFVYPLDTFAYKYKGEMIYFKKQHFSMCVTQNHRIPIYNRATSKLKTVLSQDVFNVRNGDYSLYVSGKLSCASAITPDFIRLFVALQADGSFRDRQRHGKEISFKIKKDRKIDRLQSLLNACNIKFGMYDTTNDMVGFYINGKLASDLFDFVKYTNKKFGKWILHLSQECLEALVDEARWWDSKRNTSGNSWQYYSIYRENCEWLQTAAHLTGRRATVYNDHPTVFTTNVTDNKIIASFDKFEKELIDYDGYVFSLQVPSSYYVIRREGLISITGNSAGPTVLANSLKIKLADAKSLIELDQRIDPSLGMWHKSIQDELKKTRTLTNLLGRQHRFLDRWSDQLFRSAYSYKPQSTVGDLLNVALKKLYNSLPSIPWEIEILLQLHDALYVMVEEENIMPTIKHIRNCMLIPLKYNYEEFTVDIDFKVKTSWAEGEELELNWR